MKPQWSRLAETRQTKRMRIRRIKPWGIMIHTTGRGVVSRGAKLCREPVELAMEQYMGKASVHYAIGPTGNIYQMMPDNWRGAHCGVSLKERHAYLTGRWEREVSPVAKRFWKERWPSVKTPQHLYPTVSPNGCYLGVEVVPLAERTADGWWFSDEQHQAIIELCEDRARHHRWPDGWFHTPRLVGHEDCDAYGRWQMSGGWDPGFLRENPRFDWNRVYKALDGFSGNVPLER